MNEIWKPVKGYEGLYEVSNLGNVRSLDKTRIVNRKGTVYETKYKGKTLTPQPRQHGYLGVPLYGKGGHKTRHFKTMAVHRLVAEAFIPNPQNLPEVNHKDECKTNNRADNLEWISRLGNVNYGTGQKRRAENARNNERSKAIVQLTRDGKFVAEYPSMQEVRRQKGYAPGNICRCAARNPQYSHAYGYVWRYASEYNKTRECL